MVREAIDRWLVIGGGSQKRVKEEIKESSSVADAGKRNRRGQEDNKHPANGQSQQAFRDGWERRWREAIEDEKRRRDKQSPNLDTKNQGMQRACDRPTDWRWDPLNPRVPSARNCSYSGLFGSLPESPLSPPGARPSCPSMSQAPSPPNPPPSAL